MLALKQYALPLTIASLLLLQVIFWSATHRITPAYEILPHVPSHKAISAFSFGDKQFYFRLLGYQIQTAGDTYGRVTALKDYDYEALTRWFHLLDSLDSKSHFMPALASYYYSQTPNTPDLEYIVDYLDMHASRDLEHKWWWMHQAIHYANHKLKDKERALALSYKLASSPAKDLPSWARQMPAILLEGLGEREEAYRFIKDIAKDYEQMSEQDKNYINYFIQNRLGYLEESPDGGF